VVGLLGVELLEESGGELGVFSGEGVKFMVGRGGGVDRWVRVARHHSAMVDAEGVVAEGSVGLAVLEWGLVLGFVAFGSILGDGWFEGVIVKVPHWQGQVPVEG